MRASLTIFSFLLSISCFAQPGGTPKVVVGIVVDQMRQDYLYRYEKKFGEGGFKRLVNQGFQLKNAHYNYVPTYTGPGHASIYTGTTPSFHGIIGNDWWDKVQQKSVNCVGDERQKPVGIAEGNGDVSPWRLLSTTISDELELATNRRAKVVGISLKDRGAVLPAGHSSDGAYWFDGKNAKFITSTYYKPSLPLWLEKFNALNLGNQYLTGEWKTLLPIEQYKESGPDDSPYENKFKGKEKPTFPYNLTELRKLNGELEMLAATPFGNDIVAECAMAAITGEALGKDEWPDMLTISFSSTDYVGHAMGPNSVEIEDVYLRLDKNIEAILNKLDAEIGKGQYVVFLTADHAVVDVPQYLKDIKMPGDYFKWSAVEQGLNEHLQQYFPGKKLIEKISNDQLFLNQELFAGDPRTTGVDYLIATELIRNYLLKQEGVADVITRQMIVSSDFNEGGIKGKVRRGFNVKRSGDIAVVLDAGWLTSNNTTGTSHGTGYTYDTHVPIIFFGYGVKPGSSSQYHAITDIAPTISVMMKIKFPSACTGQPVAELLDGTGDTKK